MRAFGFPLITVVCRSLGRFLRLGDFSNQAFADLLAAHVSALRTISAQRIGDGGATGRAVEAELQQAIEKIRTK
jgi:hypothetical protein